MKQKDNKSKVDGILRKKINSCWSHWRLQWSKWKSDAIEDYEKDKLSLKGKSTFEALSLGLNVCKKTMV